MIARDSKTGRFGVTIADPAVKPRTATVAAIRRAVQKATDKPAAAKKK